MADKVMTADDIGNIERQSLLYDFYGALLSSGQNEIMSLYHEDNLSLSEIAAELGMTRQAVHYSLKKAEHALEEYEDKLGLLAEYVRNRELAARAAEILNRPELTAADRQELLSLFSIITE